jgi:hypothetical protein
LFRNNGSSTASCIADEVNKEVVKRGLLPVGKEALSLYTIAKYVRQAIRG